MIHKILNVTTNGPQGPINILKSDDLDELTIQVSVSAVATVSVQGRLSNGAPWMELVSITADSIQPIAMVPYLLFVITGNTGSVSMYVRD